MNKNDVSLKYYIYPTWDIVHKIEENAGKHFQGLDINIKEATMMVITELIENAVKYGAAIPGQEGVEFKFTIEKNKITTSISNGIISEKDVIPVKNHIDKIKASDSPMELYINRLKELLNNPIEGVSQLGLYRIAYEGQFKLDYKIENNILTIIATREI
jgi:hypothetical protein